MPRIYWYGPKNGKGSTHDIVSHTYPVVNSMRSHAYRIALDAHFNLASSPEHRTGASQIGMQQELLDFWVYLHDPNNKGAAQGIENGFHTTSKTGSRWVEGLHPLQNAVDSALSRSKVH